MTIRIKEIKASCSRLDDIRNIIKNQEHRFIGLDHQIDHYYTVPEGRLKLRHGKIETQLIYYQRQNRKGPKLSEVKLFPCHDPEALHALLHSALGTKVVVDKKREIYFLENIKIHLDIVKDLGSFVEIEAIDRENRFSDEELQYQCEKLMTVFGIKKEDLISISYSDMLL